MRKYEDVADQLLGFRNRDVGVGATDEQIVAAEEALEVRIRGGYRSFLEQFGWGGVGHIELYGIGDDVPSHLDLVAIARSERSEMRPRLRSNLIPVMNDGGGSLFCLDTDTEAEPTIVFWNHTAGTDQNVEVQAQDFASWLQEQLDDLSN